MTNGSANGTEGTWGVKMGLAQMLKGGVIMDVVTADQAKIAEDAGAVCGDGPGASALPTSAKAGGVAPHGGSGAKITLHH